MSGQKIRLRTDWRLAAKNGLHGILELPAVSTTFAEDIFR